MNEILCFCYDVELIPDYPNQLCYDGKSYAVAYGLPILTDYTVIADASICGGRYDHSDRCNY